MRCADVVVVGGGPVGLSAALWAVRAGLSPVLLEPHEGAVDKACGEGLMPGGVALLSSLGVHPPGQPLQGIRYQRAGQSAEADFRDGPGLGVRRTALHRCLREAVTAAGVDVLPLAAERLSQDEHDVVVSTASPDQGAGPPLRARYVIAADGLHSPTRHRMGLDVSRAGVRRWGQRRHHAVPPWSEHVEVHWGAKAEVYVTPVAKDLVGVAVLTSERAGFDVLLDGFPELRARLAGQAPVTKVRAAGPMRQRSARRVSGRVLLVGDASGYVDALTGEGISLGLAQAKAAVAAVAVQRPVDYEWAWWRVGWRYAVLTHALVQGTRPAWARRGVVRAAAAAPALFSAAVNELGRAR